MATEVLVPPLGTNVDTVTIDAWYHAEGDTVAAGEPLFSVLTDKATLDVEAPAAGVLRGVAVSAGDDAPALSRIAWICAEGEDEPSAPDVPGRPTEPQPVDAAALPAHSAQPVPDAGGRTLVSPWARTLASQHEVDLAGLQGTGPMGAIVGRDVEAAVAGVIEQFPLTGIRGAIADRMMLGAHGAAPVTLTAEVDATPLVALRSAVLRAGVRVTFSDLLLLIVSRALLAHPRLGAVFEGGRAVVRRAVHIALAVDTDRGLLAPVVRDVDRLSLPEIAAATAAAVERARNGTAAPDELRGSVFTVTNLGMLGVDAFTPIVNAPETAILGVGRIRPVPWVGGGGQVETRQALWLSLTFDHRIVDGGPAARFLRSIVHDIEAPTEEMWP